MRSVTGASPGPRTGVSGTAGAAMARELPASNPPETVAPARRKSRRLSAFLFSRLFRLAPFLSFMVGSSLGSTGVSDGAHRAPEIGDPHAAASQNRRTL